MPRQARRSTVPFRWSASLLLVSALCVFDTSFAWLSTATRSTQSNIHPASLLQNGYAAKTAMYAATAIPAGEDTEDEYEYVEYDSLTETEFRGSEWLVGTNWDRRANEISETWCRLAVDKDGKNVAIWGDGSSGKWSFDVASQFLSMSKEDLTGKEIWACTIEDYYYLQGTVRGWKYWAAASVLGQFQAKRLGVDPEEAGPAPWFQEEQEEQE